MKYSDKELRMIEEWAEIYLPISDMAVILDIPAHQLRTDISDINHPAHKAYHKGKIMSKVKLHKQEMDLARIGSPLALQNTKQNLLDMEDDE